MKKSILMLMLFLSVGIAYASSQSFDAETRVLLKQTIADTQSFEDKYAAEVWLVDMSHRLSRYVKDPELRLKILRTVHKEALRHDIEPELVLAVIQIESAFDPYAISVVGAQGLMQVMPFWRKEMGDEQANLTDIETNIAYGCAILRTYLNREKGRVPPALARYNGSYGSYKYSNKVINALRHRWYSGN